MSISFIYQPSGLRGFDYVRQYFATGTIILKVQPKDALIRCPCCRSRNIIDTALRSEGFRLCPSASNLPGWSFPCEAKYALAG